MKHATLVFLVGAGCQQGAPTEHVVHHTPFVAARPKMQIEPPVVVLPPRASAPLPPPHVGRRRDAPPPGWFTSLSRDERKKVLQVCRLRAEDPCSPILRPWSAEHPDPADALLAGMTETKREGLDGYCEQDSRNRHARGCNTPLVLAAADRPIELRADGRAFAFHAGDPVTTDWPTAATPWIALDRDGDGKITSGSELFGDATVPGAHDGFAALAALDANSDGVIDAKDPMFAKLLLWSDRNGDRLSSPDELTPLASVVTAVPLAHSIDARCDLRGNCEGERSQFGNYAVVDLYLREITIVPN